MANDWYIKQNDKTHGPYSSSEFKNLAASGTISNDAYIANTLDGPWYHVSSVKGLNTKSLIPTEHLQRPKIQQSDDIAAEQLIWSGRPSQVTNIKTFIICGLLFWLIVPILIAGWRWLILRCKKYELTTQRLRTSYGVISRYTDELELYRIKDTTLTQNVFQRIMGLATIHIKTSDPSTPLISIDSITASQAKTIREQIRTLTETLRDRKRVREVDYT